jgi:ferredoxin
MKITICTCSSRKIIDREAVVAVAASLQNAGYSVNVIPDLCRMAQERSPEMSEIASDAVIACHPRAVKSLFAWIGLPAPQQLECLRDTTTADVLKGFGIAYITDAVGMAASDDGDASPTESASVFAYFSGLIASFPSNEGADAWFPIIDKERCAECGKCNDFCLFGVYTVENKHVRVVNPQKCKNNCPACARMCPSRAIIFPKYTKSPVNGGSAEEEIYSPEETDRMYRERLRQKLAQRRAAGAGSLLRL